MPEEFPGKGNRKPLLDINVNLIELDKDNPRIVPYLADSTGATQLDLTSILLENFDTDIVALSLVENGYFDEEPIVVVLNKKPENFSFTKYKTPEDLSKELKKLIDSNQITFTVVEGNRRLCSIKLITDNDLRNKLGIDKYYPRTTDQKKIYDITNIPCIIYEDREEVAAYLGVRHIAGLLKWEAFAQAAYTASVIEAELKKGITISDAVKEVQKVVGDRSDKLRRQYIAYKLFLQARDDIDFDVKPIINKFSLLTVAYNSASIREYMGVESYAKVNLDLPIVSSDNYDKFTELLTWIYGNRKTGEQPVLTDSRKITNTLSHIVKNKEAVEYLNQFRDITGAFERTNGEREYLIKKLTDGFRAIQISLKFAYKYKNDDALLKQVTELEELIGVLKSNLS